MELSKGEDLLLELLIDADGKIVTHEDIAIKIGRFINRYDGDCKDYSRVVIKRLRDKIDSDKIINIRGKGYKLIMPTNHEKKQKQAILEVLSAHRGEENRISRSLLRILIPDFLSDRSLRKYIEELRTTDKQGAWICASLKGGYFLARNLKELEKFTGSDHRRAINTLIRVRKQRKAAGLLVFPQLELEI